MEGTTTPELYFAYGSNMASAVFLGRVRGESMGPGRLADHMLVFDLPSQRWTGYAANVVPVVGDEVWGRLWRVESDQLTRLDEFEGAYHRIDVAVERQSPADPTTATVAAFTYTVRPERRADDPGVPVAEYLDHMLTGARECGLSMDYITRLEAARTSA